MRIRLITGGARAGKSRYAEARARELGGSAVTFIATAIAADEEMQRRIERHRAARPAEWRTIEAPRGAGGAIRKADTHVVVLDCLTTLTGNVFTHLYRDGEDAVIAAMVAVADEIVAAAGAAKGEDLLVVTNEVGFGVHPDTAAGRWYRDGLGIVNQMVAGTAKEVILMVCGVPIFVRGPLA
jgi:adenosyl cobinamide kinase/adenosyl cobinamide phosphate guanylyltransferase